jgi:hypothetical protein
VVSLPHLVAMVSLPAHIQAVSAQARLARSRRSTLGRAELTHKRPLQPPQRRQLPASSHQLTPGGRDIPMPSEVRRVQLIVDQHRRLLARRRAGGKPATHRPRRAAQRRGRLPHDQLTEHTVTVVLIAQPADDAITRPQDQHPVTDEISMRSGVPSPPTLRPVARNANTRSRSQRANP